MALRFRLLLAVLTFVGLALSALSAEAQTISTPIIRERANPRPVSEFPHWVSYADCVANVNLEFDVTLTGADGNVTLEVWAGTGDCSDKKLRENDTTDCWKVYAASPNATELRIQIPSQKIVAQQTPGSSEVKTCDDAGARQSLTLTFMFTRGSDALSPVPYTGTGTGTIGIDVTAPSAPGNISIASGENRLHLDWSKMGEGDLLGYNFYCDPPPGALPEDGGVATATGAQLLDGSADAADGAADSSTGADASGSGGSTSGAGGAAATPTDGGSDAAAATNPDCPSSVLRAGSRPNPAYKCGSVTGKTATSGKAEGLVNGQTYGVAIAAVDSVGNVGKLSAVECGTPVLVTDFYEYYRDLNGGGGGGFCTVSTGRQGSPTAAAIPLSLLGLLLLRRRARRS